MEPFIINPQNIPDITKFQQAVKKARPKGFRGKWNSIGRFFFLNFTLTSSIAVVLIGVLVAGGVLAGEDRVLPFSLVMAGIVAFLFILVAPGMKAQADTQDAYYKIQDGASVEADRFRTWLKTSYGVTILPTPYQPNPVEYFISQQVIWGGDEPFEFIMLTDDKAKFEGKLVKNENDEWLLHKTTVSSPEESTLVRFRAV